MDYPIPSPEVQGRSVVVRMSGIFSEPQLLVDGNPVAGKDGVFTIPQSSETDETASAKTTEIRLRTPMLDFVPIVEIDGKRVAIAPELPSWAYLWCLVPTIILLIFARGILPALVGLALSYFSLYQLRAAPANRRYLWSAVFNVGTIAFAVALRLAAMHHGHAPHR